MKPGNLLRGHSEETERVIVAQVRLCSKRKKCEVVERSNVVRMDASCIELRPICGVTSIGMGDRGPQEVQL